MNFTKDDKIQTDEVFFIKLSLLLVNNEYKKKQYISKKVSYMLLKMLTLHLLKNSNLQINTVFK